RILVEHHRKMSHEKLSREIPGDCARIHLPGDSERGFAADVEDGHRGIDALIEVHELFLTRPVEIERSGRVRFAVKTLVEKRDVQRWRSGREGYGGRQESHRPGCSHNPTELRGQYQRYQSQCSASEARPKEGLPHTDFGNH